MFQRTDDLRITEVRPLIPPAILIEEIPVSERASNVISDTRAALADVIAGRDDRFVVIAGPCSIHDPAAALEYAGRLKTLADRYAGHRCPRADTAAAHRACADAHRRSGRCAGGRDCHAGRGAGPYARTNRGAGG